MWNGDNGIEFSEANPPLVLIGQFPKPPADGGITPALTPSGVYLLADESGDTYIATGGCQWDTEAHYIVWAAQAPTD